MLGEMRRPKAKETVIDIICIAIYIICISLSKYRISSIVSIAVFTFYCMHIMEDKGYFYIKYLYIVFVTFAAIVSCAIIEFGSLYLKELRVSAHYYGSLPLFVLSYHILFRTLISFEKVNRAKIRLAKFKIVERKETRIIKYISIFTLLIVLACFVKVLPHPAFLNSLERADYARMYGVTGILGQLAANIPRLIIFPYILFLSKNKRNKTLAASCIFFAVLYYFWTGNKFGVFFQLLYIFLMVFSEYIAARIGKQKLKKIVVKIGIAFAGLIVITLVIQSFTYKGRIWVYFQQRIASQGQLWWRIFGLYNGTPHVSEFWNEIVAAFTAKSDVIDNIGANYGIYKMMYLCLPSSVVDAYLKAGYRYTEAGFASMLYYFGFVGPIIYALLMGGTFGLFINKLCKAINNHDFIRIYIYVRFILLATTSFSMFIFKPFFTIAQLVLYLYLIFTHNKKVRIGSITIGDKTWISGIHNYGIRYFRVSDVASNGVTSRSR